MTVKWSNASLRGELGGLCYEDVVLNSEKLCALILLLWHLLPVRNCFQNTNFTKLQLRFGPLAINLDNGLLLHFQVNGHCIHGRPHQATRKVADAVKIDEHHLLEAERGGCENCQYSNLIMFLNYYAAQCILYA